MRYIDKEQYEYRFGGLLTDIVRSTNLLTYLHFALFRVSCNEVKGRRNVKKMRVRVTHKKIFNLLPSTNYSIQVKAMTSKGYGPTQLVVAGTRQYARQYIQCCYFDHLN